MGGRRVCVCVKERKAVWGRGQVGMEGQDEPSDCSMGG